jgi:hypothetical protein
VQLGVDVMADDLMWDVRYSLGRGMGSPNLVWDVRYNLGRGTGGGRGKSSVGVGPPRPAAPRRAAPYP